MEAVEAASAAGMGSGTARRRTRREREREEGWESWMLAYLLFTSCYMGSS